MRPNCSVNMAALDASIDEVGIVIPASQVIAASVQAVVTGTSTGTLNLQFSNDIAPPVDSFGKPAPTHWSNIATIGTVAIAGAGVYSMPKLDVAYQYIRTSFTHTNAASGTITVNISTLGY